MTDYPAYPEYQETGIPWLGEIPSHWEVVPLKYFTTCLDSQRIPLNAEERAQRQGQYPYWGANGIVDYLNDWLFDEKLVLLGEDGAPFFDPFKDVAFVVEGKIWVNNHIHVLKLRDGIDHYFFAQCLNIVNYSFFIEGSTRDKLNQGKMNAIPVQLPPLPEQRAIATFLDERTARLDAAAAEYRRLADLLREQRAALISHAVTQGLDPDVPRKDSGIPWLGEIPAHWDVVAVWTLFELGRGRVISNEEIHNNRGPYPVYSSQTANQGIFGRIDTYDFEGVYLTWTTDGANAGTVFYREGKFNCTNVCGTLKATHPDVEPKFFEHALNNATAFFVRHDINPKLMNNVMARIRVQFPPLSEQRAIAAYLDRETARIDAALDEIDAAISHIEEYRAALIAAAVTGKINVQVQRT